MTKPQRRASTAAQTLRGFIASELRPGDKLPSESELTRRLGVGRITVREALGQLWTEGLVYRRWGVGTFVRDRSPRAGGTVTNIYVDVGGVGSLAERIRADGCTPGLAHAEVEQQACSASLAQELGVDPGTPVWRVERCITIDGTPSILLRDHVPTQVNGQAFDAEQLTSLESDFPTLIQQTGTRVVRDEACLDAVVADERTAVLLEVEPGSALVRAHQTSQAASGDVVVSTDVCYRSSSFSIMLVRTTSA